MQARYVNNKTEVSRATEVCAKINYHPQTGWRNYHMNDAFDGQGNARAITKIRHDQDISMDTAQLSETVCVNMPFGDLVKLTKDGVDIKIYGKNHADVLSINGDYLIAFLLKTNKAELISVQSETNWINKYHPERLKDYPLIQRGLAAALNYESVEALIRLSGETN